MNFMNLPEEKATEEAYFYILPIEYEHNPTYGTGAKNGSKEIIKASQHLEYYDEQFENEPYEKGIHILEPLEINSPEELNKITETTSKIKNKFLIALGGDHAITPAITKGIQEKFSVIILDAHSDFRYSWNNSTQNHACTARNIAQKNKIGIIGVRSQDIDEAKEISKNNKVTIIKAYEFDEKKLKEMLNKLDEKVYISIDADVFDPAFIRNTGTPEPGGLSWDKAIEILKTIFENKNVIGADIVEFAPKNNYEAEAFALAKLAYKIMSLKIKYNKD